MGVRAGQGYGVSKPKRLICPKCGKKGVGQWKVVPGNQVRSCQYCVATWTTLTWQIDSGKKTMAEVVSEILKPAEAD